MFPLSKASLEKHQILLYVVAVAAGLLVAMGAGRFAPVLEPGINPAIGFLLYVTFLQVPVASLKRALTRGRFMAALLTTNFVVVPLVVFALVQFLPGDPVIRFAVALVLLAPCIDYVVVFTEFGKGDSEVMLAATPILLAAQMALLPLFLGVGLGAEAAALISPGPFLHAFLWLIVVPLGLALLTQWLAARVEPARRWADFLGWMPVPAMCLVLFIVFAAIVPRVGDSIRSLGPALGAYVAFAVIMPLVAKLVGRFFKLPPPHGRTLAFSASIRNSLVVLPIALALPQTGELAASTVICQTIVELIAVLVYIRWIPRIIR
jgi:ACR3 family arsenite transporter